MADRSVQRGDPKQQGNIEKHRRVKDGDCSSCLVRITCGITELPMNVIRENTKLRKKCLDDSCFRSIRSLQVYVQK